MITQQRLKERFFYDPDTGNLIWKISRPGVRIGAIAGSITCAGYLYIGIDGQRYMAHRLIWLYVYGVWPKHGIDHVNHVKTDNRISNLREATNAENTQNKIRPRKDSTTNLIGVSPRCNGFIARIQLNGTRKCLGTFKTPELAYKAYLDAKKELHPFGTL